MPKITKFKGLRNTTTADRLKPGELTVAQNVDIDDTERIQSRRGFAVVQALTNSHSLWSYGATCLFVHSGALKRLHADETVSTIRALASNQPMAYTADALGVIYYSNGVDKGRVVNGVYSCWGIPTPVSQPNAVASIGNLPAGIYQYALTFVRSDGMEGGTGIAGTITLAKKGGISFSSIEVSANAEITGKILYLSTTNGEVLYRMAVLANATTTFLYQGDSTDLTVPLATQFASAPPAGEILEIYNGIMYVITGNVAYHSDPYAYETFRLADKFLQFPDKVTMFAGLNTSVWVSTYPDRVFHLRGDKPGELKSLEVDAGAAIPGTVAKTTSALFAKAEATSGTGAGEAGTTDTPVVVWFSGRGLYAGYDTGEAHNLSEANYSMPGGQLGAAMVRQIRGYSQILTTIQGTGVASNVAS